MGGEVEEEGSGSEEGGGGAEEEAGAGMTELLRVRNGFGAPGSAASPSEELDELEGPEGSSSPCKLLSARCTNEERCCRLERTEGSARREPSEGREGSAREDCSRAERMACS